MKLTISLFLLLICSLGFAQDKIKMKSGELYEVKISGFEKGFIILDNESKIAFGDIDWFTCNDRAVVQKGFSNFGGSLNRIYKSKEPVERNYATRPGVGQSENYSINAAAHLLESGGKKLLTSDVLSVLTLPATLLFVNLAVAANDPSILLAGAVVVGGMTIIGIIYRVSGHGDIRDAGIELRKGSQARLHIYPGVTGAAMVMRF